MKCFPEANTHRLSLGIGSLKAVARLVKLAGLMGRLFAGFFALN
jgi:hypothetical protein